MNQLDRAVGTLLGLACGDAVGTTLEFCAPGTFEPITDMVGGGPLDGTVPRRVRARPRHPRPRG
jgi:ADP-ribosylglycohydrolase